MNEKMVFVENRFMVSDDSLSLLGKNWNSLKALIGQRHRGFILGCIIRFAISIKVVSFTIPTGKVVTHENAL